MTEQKKRADQTKKKEPVTQRTRSHRHHHQRTKKMKKGESEGKKWTKKTTVKYERMVVLSQCGRKWGLCVACICFCVVAGLIEHAVCMRVSSKKEKGSRWLRIVHGSWCMGKGMGRGRFHGCRPLPSVVDMRIYLFLSIIYPMPLLFFFFFCPADCCIRSGTEFIVCISRILALCTLYSRNLSSRNLRLYRTNRRYRG
ncbi:hypothetical protein BCR41DRAFT_201782 [Lobosporangium transversale]|uniref:Uncharacterized protein n=1 Tax=Lobosporangium transversale TaxID=64571 RepID=A0A1Y2GWD1_9FUNG|nr:hypothetical protein BCR41DRAFT_201782 [Lobosporangium transversale]ORZ26575.1 hypothetical protein BCR41DRAFT_201782 [Lobosporangium transversale]|eukprot:XP_021884338.1 hypothetical protein BCR41DRAFT_201782 [Lobosporangium transversale]